MDGWMDRRMGVLVDGRTSGWMDGLVKWGANYKMLQVLINYP